MTKPGRSYTVASATSNLEDSYFAGNAITQQWANLHSVYIDVLVFSDVKQDRKTEPVKKDAVENGGTCKTGLASLSCNL